MRRIPGVTFAKMLGCGKGETFTPSDADVHRWGFLLCINESQIETFDNSAMVKRWRKHSQEEFRVLLDPISSHGFWSKNQPFLPAQMTGPTDGMVVAITRARIAWRKNVSFWKAVPAVTESLLASQGLIGAIGVGEAPVGLQGTFSLWESEESLKTFAFRSPAHKAAIQSTTRQKWFSEELFARFSVKEIRGRL
jgi:hypothetical protein